MIVTSSSPWIWKCFHQTVSWVFYVPMHCNTVLQVGPDKTEFKVEGLTPRKKYKFRVRAVNKEGESEPLETDEAIEARNPYGKRAPETSTSARNSEVWTNVQSRARVL